MSMSCCEDSLDTTRQGQVLTQLIKFFILFTEKGGDKKNY